MRPRRQNLQGSREHTQSRTNHCSHSPRQVRGAARPLPTVPTQHSNQLGSANGHSHNAGDVDVPPRKKACKPQQQRSLKLKPHVRHKHVILSFCHMSCRIAVHPTSATVCALRPLCLHDRARCSGSCEQPPKTLTPAGEHQVPHTRPPYSKPLPSSPDDQQKAYSHEADAAAIKTRTVCKP